MRSIRLALTVLAFLVLASGPAYPQVTTSIAGVIVDSSGAFIPGATITVKHNGTTAESTAISGENGTFAIPALNPGTYTVTVTLSGFKTAVVNDVVLTGGTPGSVKVTLEVGAIEETVTVEGGSEIIHTQSPTISTTVDANRIINLPLSSRSGLDFVVFLPGVNTAGGSRDSIINGLPQSAIAITWDGVNVQDNHLKTTDGFFAIISPRLDAIEEVTLTSAAQGAEATGQGATRINFVTRSGSNRYSGSAYHYYRNDALNSNTWSRNRDGLPKANLLQNQPGVRFGGPIWIPKVYNGRDKAFFFVNYEQFRQPGEFTVNRTIMHPRTQQGFFRYTAAGGVQEVNVLQVAAAGGHLSAVDPTIAQLLSDIRASTGIIGTIQPATNPSHETFTFPGASSSFNYYPTVRIDYNLTQNHRLTGTVNYQSFENYPDQTNNQEVRFPGFPSTAGQTSWRSSNSFAVRSTLGPNLVNEARVAYVNYEVDFSAGVSASHFSGTPVADQKGYNLTLGFGLTGATSQANMSGRQAPVREFMNTLNWLKGSHSLSFGGSWTNVRLNAWSQQLVPGISFGIDTSEAVNGMFNTANFPSASNTNLNDARALYALLTGRVSSIAGNAVLDPSGQYTYNGMRQQVGQINEVGLFVQDSWRLRPGLTINAGLRWELQTPFQPRADNYTTAVYTDVFGVSGVDSAGNPNLFQPGIMTGRPTEFVQYSKGTDAYEVEYTNFAPTAGFAWTPEVERGWLRKFLGSESVIRGGYSKAFLRNGMSDYSGIFGSNPGSQLSATRNSALANLNLDGQGLPVLFSQPTRLGPPPFAATPNFPLTVAKNNGPVVTNSVNVFYPDTKTPYTHSWTLGWQRALTRDMAAEVRYVGTRGRDLWATVNYNEFNIETNGFLNEFRQAQANLAANIAAGRGNTFAYTGAPGTAPLPIFLAHYNGLSAPNAGDPARYTGNNWTNSTFLGFLARNNPQPFSFASTNGTNGLLGNSTFRNNALNAGLAANFWVVNPGMIGGANVRTNQGFSHYDSLQIELRRRLSQGLQFQASYAFGDTWQSDFYSVRVPLLESLDEGGEGTVRHAFKVDWVYELPFGRGRRFASNVNAFMERVVGGWSFAGTSRVQSGQAVDFGNVRLVGMTVDELRDMYGLYEYPQVFTENAGMRFYRLPQDVIENTIRANAVSATSATGYGPQGPPTGRYIAPANGPGCIETIDDFGACGTRVLEITGPKVVFMDLSIVKRIEFTGRLNAEFRGEFLNAFNHPTITGGTTGVVTPSSSRIIQLVARLNW